jgi:hypothetical protein
VPTAGSETAESSVPTIWSRATIYSSAPTSYTYDELAHTGYDVSEPLDHLHSPVSTENSTLPLVLKGSPEQVVDFSANFSEFERLKDSVDSFKRKVGKGPQRTAIRSFLRAALEELEDTANVPLPVDGEPDNYIEESINVAGETIFSCRWPSCATKGQWWNLRSEIENHMKRHTEPYGCTFDHCCRRFGSKSDWRRHEVQYHFQQLCWRCDLANPSSTSAESCWETFRSKELFIAHLENVHQMLDARKVTGNLIALHHNANVQPRYWCGFCKSIRLTRNKGKGTHPERYDHIAEHITSEGRCFDDWISQEGALTEQARRKREEFVADTEDEPSDSSIGLPSSEEVVSALEIIPPPPGAAFPWEIPTSIAERRRGVKGQMESTDLLMFEKAPKADQVNASPTQELVSVSKASRDPRNTLPTQARERSVSQSSKLDSRDSEGEREFMSLAAEGRSNVGLSPGSVMGGDQDVIASIVAQIVQAYLRALCRQRTDSRQCTNSDDARSGQTPDGEIRSIAVTRQAGKIDLTEDRKRERQEDDDDIEGDDSPSKRTKLIDEEGGTKSFACPYSKHNRTRYSEMNTDMQEQNYRRCASKYLTDISRLKQHLYRIHKRPDSYCGRCFGTFTSQTNLEEHSRAHPPCPVVVCPFPEKMTHDQKIIIKRRRDAKDQVAVWFFVYETLFPGSTKPESPYVEIVSIEAAASFQQWYESPEFVAHFREFFDARVAEAFPDTSVQFRMQMILEESLSDLAWHRGPNFHSSSGYGRQLGPSDASLVMPGSRSTEQLFEDTGSGYAGMIMPNNATSTEPGQSDNIESSLPTLSGRENIPGHTADNETDFTTQGSLSPLDPSSHANLEAFGEASGHFPPDYLQDSYAFSTMTSVHELDYASFSGQELTLDMSDPEENVPPSVEHPRDDSAPQRSKGKCRAR